MTLSLGMALSIACSAASTAYGDVDVDARLRESADKTGPRNVIRIGGNPDGRRRIVLDDSAALPSVGEPFVIPATESFGGVLGIVTSAKRLPGGNLRVTTRPATLDQAYAKLTVDLEDATLRELEPEASASLAEDFECTGSGPGPDFNVEHDFSKLEPQFELNVRRREGLFRLRGPVRLGVKLSVEAAASCSYVGHAQVDLPIAGTPIVVTLKPAFSGDTSGAIESGLDWAPAMDLGVERGGGETRAFRDFDLKLDSLKIRRPDGAARAGLFLGANVGISVADRVGIEGQAGPGLRAEVKPQGASICIGADAYLHADLTGYADVFFKRWELEIADGDFAERRLFDRCFP